MSVLLVSHHFVEVSPTNINMKHFNPWLKCSKFLEEKLLKRYDFNQNYFN